MNFPRSVTKDHLISQIPIYSGTMVKYCSAGFHYRE